MSIKKRNWIFTGGLLPVFPLDGKAALLTSLSLGVQTQLNLLDLNDLSRSLSIGVASYVLACLALPLLGTCLQLGGGYLFSSWSAASTALRFGSHMAALKFMDRYIDDPNDAVETLTVLKTMTATDEHILKMVGEMGGIETTVKALEKHSEDSADVARSGCGLLMNICGYSETVNETILECGGITAIVEAMKYWPKDERVQGFACTALARLAESSDANLRKKIIDVGGLVTLAEARTTHQNDLRVRLPASHALTELVQLNKC